MRVFYVDEDESQESRLFYVKLDNIQVPYSELRLTQSIEARTTKELIEKILQVYDFKEELRGNLELWSKPSGSMGRERLDTKSVIPKEYEDVWVRGVANNKNK